MGKEEDKNIIKLKNSLMNMGVNISYEEDVIQLKDNSIVLSERVVVDLVTKLIKIVNKKFNGLPEFSIPILNAITIKGNKLVIKSKIQNYNKSIFDYEINYEFLMGHIPECSISKIIYYKDYIETLISCTVQLIGRHIHKNLYSEISDKSHFSVLNVYQCLEHSMTTLVPGEANYECMKDIPGFKVFRVWRYGEFLFDFLADNMEPEVIPFSRLDELNIKLAISPYEIDEYINKSEVFHISTSYWICDCEFPDLIRHQTETYCSKCKADRDFTKLHSKVFVLDEILNEY